MTDIAGDWVAYNGARFPTLPLENAETHEVTSWRQLEGRVSRLAGALIERFGITKGDRVSMLAENDTRVFEIQFACMRLGAIFVPLNWRLAPPELEQQCGDAEPTLIVHDEVWQEAAYNLGTGIGVDRYLSWRVRDTPADLDEAIHRASPFAATRDNVMDDPTHILFTSGTTGRPKGALTTFGTLAWQTANIAHTNFLDGPGCKLFNPLPLFHAGGLTTLASPLLRTGACVAVARRFDPEQALSYIGDPARGVTHFGSVPTMWQMMMDIPAFARADFSGFRHSQIAGSSPPEDAIDGPGGAGHRAPATVRGDRARAQRLERPPGHGAQEARVVRHPRPLQPGPARRGGRRRRGPGNGGRGLPGRSERQPRLLGQPSRAPREPGRRLAPDR